MPFRISKDLTEEICESNFARICAELGRGEENLPADVARCASIIPVTHTMGIYHVKAAFLLGATRGLLSRKEQQRDRYVRSKNVAELIGIYEYVCAYHGIHDAYYSRVHVHDGNHRLRHAISNPVGLFIERRCEEESNPRWCNASYRDYGAHDTPPPYHEWLLTPNDARRLVAIESMACHDGDFWRYWGEPGAQRFKRTHHWKHLFEFHFYKHVRLDSIAAIIWPFQISFRNGTRTLQPEGPRLLERLVDIHSKLHVIQYDASQRPAVRQFLKASADAARAYADSEDFSPLAIKQRVWK